MDLIQTNPKFEVIYELTMVDIIILQTLMKNTKPIVRFKILEDINHQLPTEKTLTAPKFYNNLKKLSEKELINVQEGKKSGSSLIEISEIARQLLEVALFSILFGNVDYKGLLDQIIPRFLKEVEISHKIKNMLVIFPKIEKHLDTTKLESIAKMTNQLYILATNEQFEHYRIRNPSTPYLLTELAANRIREAEEFFECVVFIGTNHLQNQEESLIKEMFRVTSKFLVFGFIAPVYSDHFLVQPVIRGLKTSFHSVFTSQQILDLMDAEKVKDKGRYDDSGFVFIWVKKKN